MADKRISQLIERTDIANNDVLPIVASGATTTNKVTISTIQDWMQDNLDVGVTSVGLTLGTTGTDVNVTGSPITTSGNITINIPDASASNRGVVTTGSQVFGGVKTFANGFILPSAGGSNQASRFVNIGTIHEGSAGSNQIGFNNSNNIYFGKGLSNGGVIQWTNAAVRYYTLPDADGTLALASQLDGYVTLGTAQTITAQKTFSTSGSSDTAIINHGSGSGIALNITKAGNGEGLRVAKTSGSGNAVTITGGLLSAEAATLTGALNGTSASFTGAVNGQQGIFRNSGVPALQVIRDLNVVSVGSAGQGIEFGALNGTTPTAGAAIYGGLDNPATTGNLVFQTLTGGTLTTKLTLASAGAATFSSSVTAGGRILTTASGNDTFGFQLYRSGTSTTIAGLYQNTTGDGLIVAYNSAGSQNVQLNTNGVSYFNGGNVGIGTAANTTGFSRLVLNGSSAGSESGIQVNYNGSTFGGFALTTLSAAGGGMSLYTYTGNVGSESYTERMRITSGGYLKAKGTESTYQGITSTYHELRTGTGDDWITFFSNTAGSPYGIRIHYPSAAPNNTSNLFLLCSDMNANRFIVLSNGNVQNQNNSYGAISDIKLKENITDASPKLNDLLKVKVRNYNFIGDEKKQIGVIAQELEEIFPAMIEESDDFEEVEVPQLDEEGNEVLNEEGKVVTEKQRVSKGTTTKSVKYSVFVPMLIKAIQEQQEQINQLKNQIK
jgi:hypothetical protein